MATHKDLDIWKLGIDLVEKIYALSTEFPSSEVYGLTAQMRRAAVSIPSNIAEGAARSGAKEYVRFLYVSLGSLAELDTQLIIAKRLGYIQDMGHIEEDIEKLRRYLLNFIKRVKNS